MVNAKKYSLIGDSHYLMVIAQSNSRVGLKCLIAAMREKAILA